MSQTFLHLGWTKSHIQGNRECDRHRTFRLATHSPRIRSLRANSAPQEVPRPNRILATCPLGSGDLPEPLKMTLAERVEFLDRAETGRHLVAANACCELLAHAKSVNQFQSCGGLRSLSFLEVTDDRQVEQIADFVERRVIRVLQAV